MYRFIIYVRYVEESNRKHWPMTERYGWK